MTNLAAAQEERLREAFIPLIEQHSLVLDSLKVQHVGATVRMTVVVDLPEDELGSVDLDTVTDVSRDISALLDDDESLIGPGPSNLEVTTPGIFRPHTELRHFKRSRTRMFTVEDREGRQFLGRLQDVEGDTLVFDVVKPPHQPKKVGKAAPDAPRAERIAPGEHRIALADVNKAEIYVEFR